MMAYVQICPGLFTADTGLPQALDDIKSKKNQFQRSKNFT